MIDSTRQTSPSTDIDYADLTQRGRTLRSVAVLSMLCRTGRYFGLSPKILQARACGAIPTSRGLQ